MANVPVPGLPVVTPATGDTVVGVKAGAVKRMPVGGSGLAAGQSTTTFSIQQIFQDTSNAATSLVDVRHNSDGSGHISGQTFGVDIHNNNGAKQALVIHQYSAVSEAMRIDNTDSQPSLYILNTENLILNPDGIGTGDFIKCDDHGTVRFLVTGQGRLSMVQANDITTRGVDIAGGTAAQEVVRISGRSNQPVLNIVTVASSAGGYPMVVNGQDYGPRVVIVSNGGDGITITKSATGSGRCMVISNAGTGLSLDVRSATASLFAVTSAGIPQWVAAANQQTTVGAAGGASALPATPTKYLKVVDSAGTTYVIPAYAAA